LLLLFLFFGSWFLVLGRTLFFFPLPNAQRKEKRKKERKRKKEKENKKESKKRKKEKKVGAVPLF
jgi:hypothetical protein